MSRHWMSSRKIEANRGGLVTFSIDIKDPRNRLGQYSSERLPSHGDAFHDYPISWRAGL